MYDISEKCEMGIMRVVKRYSYNDSEAAVSQGLVLLHTGHLHALLVAGKEWNLVIRVERRGDLVDVSGELTNEECLPIGSVENDSNKLNWQAPELTENV